MPQLVVCFDFVVIVVVARCLIPPVLAVRR